MEWNLSLYSRGSPCYSSRRLRTSPPWTLAPPAPLPEAQGLVRPPSSAVVCVWGGPFPLPLQPGRPQAARGDHLRPAPLEVEISTRRRDSGVRGRCWGPGEETGIPRDPG